MSSVETLAATAGLELALARAAMLGEGLQWHAGSGRWWWTDIESAALYAWTPGAAAPQAWRLPDRLGCFAHTRSGRVLLGLAKRLCLATLPVLQADGSAAALQQLCGVDTVEPRTRINDGRCDRAGRFWLGSMVMDMSLAAVEGALYRVNVAGLSAPLVSGLVVPNGVAFSADGKTMYVMAVDNEAGAPYEGRVLSTPLP